MKRIWTLLALLLLPSTLPAQAPAASGPTPAHVAAMQKLDWLVGDWRGEATVDGGPSGIRTVNQTETIRRRANGLALAIEGIGKEGDRVVHDAFAVIHYDPQAGAYRMRTVLGNGQSRDPEIVVSDGRIVWSFTAGPMRIRYTINRTAEGGWHEIGEASRDGTNWRKMIELHLRKQPAATTP